GTTGSFAINKGLWDSLTKNEQLLIETVIQAEAMIQGAEFNARNLASLDVLVKKHDVKLRRYSDEMLTKIGTISGQVVADIGNADATSKKIYESYIAFRKQSLSWAKLSEQGFMNARLLPFKYA
nr:ABC transporter substrate-binding protein [Alphaproteobacteria bacterium]